MSSKKIHVPKNYLYYRRANISRATIADVPDISKLRTEHSRYLFGDVDIKDQLCKGYMTITARTASGKLMSAMSMQLCPNCPTLSPSHWTQWVMNLYRIEGISPKNALWVHLAVFDPRYGDEFVRPILQHFFYGHPEYQYVLFLIPPRADKMIPWLKDVTTTILPAGFASNVQTIQIAARQDFVDKYKIRRAVEEDNDDLVPLIDTHSKRLKDIYGNFYVAELLTRFSDGSRQTMVAEKGGIAVAVLSLNDRVNLDALNESFELGAFYGLHKPNQDDIVQDNISESTFLLTKSLSSLNFSSHQAETEAPSDLSDDSISENQSAPQALATPGTTTAEESRSSESFELLLKLESTQKINKEESPCGSTEVYDREKLTSFTPSGLSMQPLGERGSSAYPNIDTSDINTLATSATTADFVGVYTGASNAFALELAACWPSNEDAMYFLITACFECYPDKDYCVITIPSNIEPMGFLEYFVRATPRCASSYNQEMYLLHRNALSSSIIIRLYRKPDLRAVESFFRQLKRASREQFGMFCDAVRLRYQVYLFISGTDLVGICSIKFEDEVEYLKRCFDLEELTLMSTHRHGQVGRIVQMIVSPIFQSLNSYFVRELHRLSEYTMLTYKLFTDMAFTKHRCVAVILSQLTGVKPKKAIEARFADHPEHALYVSTMNLCSMPQYHTNQHIVVVGSGITSVAFLEYLILANVPKYKMIFTNVTVVAPHNISKPKSLLKMGDFFPVHSSYTPQYIRMINFKAYVNFIRGHMTAIDRPQQHIVIDNGNILTYDLLFLLCGEQFPNPTINKQVKSRREMPKNAFVLNGLEEARSALRTLLKVTNQKTFSNTIVIYGNYIEMFSCARALLEYGVKPQDLIIIAHYVKHKTQTMFPDYEVDVTVFEFVRSMGIKILSGYTLIDWNLDGQNIVSAKFDSGWRMEDIELKALFMYNPKSISYKTFMAINRAGLVFDGRLVIGPDFRTNDKCIFAAGRHTKYSRRYYAEHMIQKYYNREEIGIVLAKRIRKMLVPAWDEDSRDTIRSKCLIQDDTLMPRFEWPMFTYCCMPGGLHYLHVHAPGAPEPIDSQTSDDNFGDVYITGDLKNLSTQGYFKLHFNQYRNIETIVCLSRQAIDYVKLVNLWGKHERLLNNLIERFEMVLIPDFYEYFDEPWLAALYHTEFPRFQNNLTHRLMDLKDKQGHLLTNVVEQKYMKNNWKAMQQEDIQEILNLYRNAKFKSIVEDDVLAFIAAYLEDFPMYAHPVVVRMLLQGYKNCELFTDL